MGLNKFYFLLKQNRIAMVQIGTWAADMSSEVKAAKLEQPYHSISLS